MDARELWKRFRDNYFYDEKSAVGIDISRVNFPEGYFSAMGATVELALNSMDKLEGGAIANPDEKRMVGHYWLRTPELAPRAEISEQITSVLNNIKGFARDVHSGKVGPAGGKKFKYMLVIGIGGSALGPQFVNQALGSATDPLKVYFFDNTDPEGMQKVLAAIPSLGETLCIVTSKSGGTKETRNGQLVAKAAFESAGLEFSKHFVAVTGEGSELDKTAIAEQWRARFPMWDWVGGRTSEFSAVGLLPAALQGFDIDAMLTGAREMDVLTRRHEVRENPAALLALMWFHVGSGKGLKDMVVLPYKDRLELFSRYLQQLVMESLGKERDLAGEVVNQGLAVYGNKGSTDQHAYVQQLREGLNNFFTVFVEVLKDDSGIDAGAPLRAESLQVEPGVTSGDYLTGFLLGTRSALFENQRESVTITVKDVSAQTVGQLIALFERAVGLYASLVNINAYHQPGVEAGKKAAAKVLATQAKVLEFLRQNQESSVDSIAQGIESEDEAETVFKLLRHLAANGRVRISRGPSIFDDRYSSASA